MKSIIDYDNKDNVYVLSKQQKIVQTYYNKLLSARSAIHNNAENTNVLLEGTKVRLNYESLTQEPAYKNKRQAYKDFVEQNKDTIFTVEYDEKYKNNPILVSLKEDNSQIKWLWHCEYDLIVIE